METKITGQLWQRAVSFAARKHQGQLRKDGQTPYFAHPVRVALVVRHVFGEADETALMAALLHDLIEDTTSGSDSQRTKFVEKAERAIRCAGDVPELQSAAKKLRSLVSG